MADHVFCNRRFGKLESEFQEFPVNPRRTPKRGFAALILRIGSMIPVRWMVGLVDGGSSSFNTTETLVGAKQSRFRA